MTIKEKVSDQLPTGFEIGKPIDVIEIIEIQTQYRYVFVETKSNVYFDTVNKPALNRSKVRVKIDKKVLGNAMRLLELIEEVHSEGISKKWHFS